MEVPEGALGQMVTPSPVGKAKPTVIKCLFLFAVAPVEQGVIRMEVRPDLAVVAVVPYISMHKMNYLSILFKHVELQAE
jgi:hypothetical protein